MPRHCDQTLRLKLATAIAATLTGAAHATNWIAGTGDWSVTANWSAGVPTAAVDALLDRAGSFAVTLNSASVARDLTVLNGPLTLDMAGRSLTLRDLSLSGTTGLTVAGGGLFASGSSAVGRGYDLVAATAGTTASLTITGVGTQYTSSGGLNVGNTAAGGNGQFAVRDGASVVIADALNVYGSATRGLLAVAGGSLTAKSIDVSNVSMNFTSGSVTVSGGVFKSGRALQVTPRGPAARYAQSNFAVNGLVGSADRPSLTLTGGATNVFPNMTGDVFVGTKGAKGEFVVNGVGTTGRAAGGLLIVGGGGAAIADAYAAGDGMVRVSGGGQFLSRNLSVGENGGVGFLTVDGVTNGVASAVLPKSDLYITDALLVGSGRFSADAGRGGDGTVRLTNGGLLDASATGNTATIGTLGGTGRVVVDGMFSGVASRLAVGALAIGNGRFAAAAGLQSDGALDVTAGGQASVGGGVRIGQGGGTGRLTVDGQAADGSASKFAATGDLAVGVGGFAGGPASDGTVTVRNGGQLLFGVADTFATALLSVGDSGVGRMTIDGAASRVATNGAAFRLNVGVDGTAGRGNGAVTLRNGAQLATASTAVGTGPGIYTSTGGAVGTLTITGAGSKLSATQGLFVGGASSGGPLPGNVGTVTLADGGALTTGPRLSDTPAEIGYGGGTGTMRVTSNTADVSTWTHNGSLRLGRPGVPMPDVGTGTLDVGPGGLVSVSYTLFVSPPGGLAGGAINLSGGTLSVGTLTLARNTQTNTVGRLNWTGGTLAIGAGDSSVGVFDVPAAGTLSLRPAAYNATLASATGIDLRPGGRAVFTYNTAVSPLTQIKSILAAGYDAGYASGTIRSTTSGAGVGIGYADSGTAITVRSTIAGDADLDGDVDFGDFVALQASFGQAGTGYARGNFNYDGLTDFGDFVLLQSNFGRTLTGARMAVTRDQFAAVMSVTNAEQVPEPAVVGVLSLSASGLMRRRRAGRAA